MNVPDESANQPPSAPATRLGDCLPPPPSAEYEQIDQYRVLGRLGQGGMGVVYRALHTSLGKLVALKVLPPDRTTPAAIERFQREMKAIGGLDHPHIVRAFDARAVDRQYLLVMELIEGIDLASLTKQCGPLSVADACELVRQAALGLQYVHERDLIHRDIKPSNLILDRSGRLKILDLGLARWREGLAASEDITAPGQFLGTVDYMAPEQASDARSVDGRADIYSLGCTLYHLLIGGPPFQRNGPDLCRLVAHQHAIPAPVRALRPEIPRELAAILERMLAKNPDDRISTPGEVAVAVQPWTVGANLARLCSPEGTTAKAPWPETVPPVPAKRTSPRFPGRGWWRAVAGVLFLGAGVLLTVNWFQPAAVPPPPREVSRPFKTEADLLATIRDDLHQLPAPARRFQRYVTLTHLVNNSSEVSAVELRWQRAAFSKLANSLSWKPAVVRPLAVDAEETVLRVDLRDLGWEEPKLWPSITRAYPYGLTHGRDATEPLRTLAQEVSALTGSELPYLRADWFVAVVARPPLYDVVLGLPPDADSLGRRLKVDVRADFLTGRLARAGVLNSAVSPQNRVVDRHDSADGAYWRTFDFTPNERRGNLVQFPLGPLIADHPFAELAFEHGGGASLFSLPNGLQGYMLVDDHERRIAMAPIDRVRDSLESAGTPQLVNGLSCLGCHKHGVVPFEDKVRNGSNASGNALIKVHQLYRPRAEMDRLLKSDEDRFLRALATATGLFLQVAEDRDRSLRTFPEPIGLVARRYADDLGLNEVALELGIAPKSLADAISTNPALRELGLGTLLEGGTIKRAVWSSREFAASLFQEAARVLKLGTPLVID